MGEEENKNINEEEVLKENYHTLNQNDNNLNCNNNNNLTTESRSTKLLWF